MNILEVQGRIIDEYAQYTRSFIEIADDTIRSSVNEHLDKKHFWPDPLLQFNPAYKSAGSIAELIESGLLHRDAKDIFSGYSLYQHQREAIELGLKKRDFVVTSGTGSGKSLTYIGSIFNTLLQEPLQPGVVAVIVYPMNALINSQSEEFKKYQTNYEKTGKKFPITFGQYTGQESEEAREKMRRDPPHIILTNYMMLELLMSRRSDFSLRDAIFNNLQFLVFDEMHTYRGRQGADVAMLIRRIRAKCAHSVTCIGTSATMVSGGTPIEQRRAVATVAQTLFGKPFEADQIIQESLERSLTRPTYSTADLRTAFSAPIDMSHTVESLQRHPIANWLENEVALEERNGTLIRRKPQSIIAVTEALAAKVESETEQARAVLAQLLSWMSNVNAQLTASGQRYTVLPYRLHQFFAQTGSVYVSLDQGENRYVTLEENRYRPDTDSKQPLFPTYFSRTTGEAFLGVQLKGSKLEPRSNRNTALHTDTDEQDSATSDGYIIINHSLWDDTDGLDLLPDEWFKQTKSGRTLNPNRRNRVPRQIWYDAMGSHSFDQNPTLPFTGWFMPFPLLFDPSSGQIYHWQTRESSKLSELGGGGRSTATTITSVAILKQLQASGYPLRDQKLLSFTDNRQDAALQAGHFNDFVQVVQFRSALYQALQATPTGILSASEVGGAVRKALALPLQVYAEYDGTTTFTHILEKYNTYFEQYLTYRLLRDAMRNWKVVLPNLEQSGLVIYEYTNIIEVCESNKFWKSLAPMAAMTVDQRWRFLTNILNFFRFQYAYADNHWFSRMDAIETDLKSNLRSPWKLEKDETIDRPTAIRLKRGATHRDIETASVGERSAVANYVRDFLAREGLQYPLRGEDYLKFIEALFEKLIEADYLTKIEIRSSGEIQPIYQLKLTALRWKLGNSEDVRTDEIRQRSFRTRKLKPNRYFQKLYSTPFTQNKRFFAQDHTGQLANGDRIDREERFRAEWVLPNGAMDEQKIRTESISTLFCSPTMELGVDIGGLSVVHMRNVPPNPSNYAQRSGRAGRSGQGALVFTYCSNAAHDQHYFKHQVDMVSGAVQPPQLDIFNEDLLRTHIHAIAIAHVGMPAETNSLKDYVADEHPHYPINPSALSHFLLDNSALRTISQTFRTAIADFAGTLSTQQPWFTQSWVDVTLSSMPHRFGVAMQRWRELYRSAIQQRISSTSDMNTAGLSVKTKAFNQIQREYYDAIRQINLLENHQKYGSTLSEFFPFRYFASEGFLPGYNFTRLPVRVSIPEDRTGAGQGAFLSRPRGIALSEFGPYNIIYHSGNKYRIQQMILPNGTEILSRAKVSTRSGYLMRNEELLGEVCPLTHVPLSDAGAYKMFTQLIELNECRAVPIERITCEEEYRVREGYRVETYFAMTGMLDRIRNAEIRHDDQVLMQMRFLPAATIINVNTGWSSEQREGFRINLESGFWNRKKQADIEHADKFAFVTPWTSTTADALYLEPLQALGLTADGVITLQYALKRALELLFQVESSEIAATTMGSLDAPNMFLYEAAEGSLGLMARFIQNPDAFGKLIEKAIELCAYDDPTYLAPASYRDLLNYYNQPHHGIIDRFSIKSALTLLRSCTVTIASSNDIDYDAQYNRLIRLYDKQSEMEKRFLDYLFDHNLRLPDDAQRLVADAYVKPDFYYDSRIWVFCDGTPHDTLAIAEHDQNIRSLLRERGDEVLVWNYRTPLETFIQSRPDIFRRVR
jgi:superfamily II DNA or RNA helicase